MSHPTDIQDRWEALTDAVRDEQAPTPALAHAAHALQQAGFTVAFLDGALWAEISDTDPATGVHDGAMLKTVQVA